MGFRRRICTFYIWPGTESAGLTIQVKHCGVPLFHKNRSCISRGQRSWSSHSQTERHANLEERRNDLDRVLLESKSISKEFLDFFSCRKITRATLERNQVTPYLSESGQAAIRFPYLFGGKIVNYKYRAIACKTFWQEKGADKIFYGIDDILGAKTIIIVEGEIDKLSMEEAGIRNCVSVPNGAPARLSPNHPSLEDGRPIDKDTKFEYLWNCHKYFKEAEQIILATDGDEPGLALAEELARRLGRERCWRVKWPSMNGKQCKDANEVLMGLGRDALVDAVEKAEHYPICGLFHFSSFYKEIEDFFDEGDQKQWFSTGWKQLDQIYKVVPGELTLVTGVPNSGKSEWIDALLCNLNKLNGWTFALCSMENRVKDHARKLLEKHFKKPFFDADYAVHQRMSRAELEQGMEWLNKTFYLIRDENEELQSIEWILDLAKAAVLRHGIRGLVIDPYNEIDHQRADKQTETEYISAMLTKIKRFAQLHDCHVWFVAHPRQMYNWNGEPPNLYDISGSAHFINKSDNGIVIHRSFGYTGTASANVQVIVRKVRNKIAGRIGKADLNYDRETGTYT